MYLSFGELVRRGRDNLQLTQDDAAKLIKLKYSVSISGAYLSMIERNERTNLTINVVNAIIDFFNLPPTSVASLFGNQVISSSASIPLLGKIRAGVPILGQENWEGQITPPEGINASFAAEVVGDSMLYAGILPGDIAFFRETSSPTYGQIVATRVTDYEAEVNLKFFINKNGQPILRSANPEYEDIEVTRKHEVVGVLVGLVRDGAPTLPDYERFLVHKENRDQRWLAAISEVTAAGLKPEQVVQLIGIMKSFINK